MRSVLIAALFVSIAFSSTATQTDWSDGAGVEGPVSSWEESFLSSEDINFNDGRLQLFAIPAFERTIDSDLNGACTITSADFDGDGDEDILGGGRYAGDYFSWWENTDGFGLSWTEHDVGFFGWTSSIVTADIDGDGDVDVLEAGYGYDQIFWWENTDGLGIIWTEHTIDASFVKHTSIYSADIDGDGDTDVLGAGSPSDCIAWWENVSGTGLTWLEHTVDGSVNGAESVSCTDIDGDGDADVLGAARYDDSIMWWENTDGTGIVWVEHSVVGDFDDVSDVFSIDMDGDGDADVLGAGFFCDAIRWWENTDGIGIVWTEHTIDGNFDGARSVYSTDVDADGDADVLGAGYYCDDITWWENTNEIGTDWVEHVVDSEFGGAQSVFSSDVNGDGNADILGAGFKCDDLVWWDIMDYSASGHLESSILDVGHCDEWSFFTSNLYEPAGTSLSFQFRSSQDYSNMGAWSDTVFTESTPLQGILADSTRYLQYRIFLETSDYTLTPDLYELAFDYVQLGIEEGSSNNSSFSLLENPSSGQFSVLLSIPEVVLVELSLYDISGRVVAVASQEFVSGTHSMNFVDLSEGVYFCTMHAGEFTATERVVILR